MSKLRKAPARRVKTHHLLSLLTTRQPKPRRKYAVFPTANDTPHPDLFTRGPLWEVRGITLTLPCALDGPNRALF